MKSIIYIIVLTFNIVAGYQEIFSRDVETCQFYRDVTQDYQVSVYEFTLQVYRGIAPVSGFHFVFSPLSVWITLATIAEGADPYTQEQLFRFLKLPNDPCVRLKYYQLATSRYLPGNDVNIVSTRVMFFDRGLAVNPSWHNFVSKNHLIDLLSAPIRYDPQGTLNAIKEISSASLANLDLSGNSVLVDAMEYNGLWTSAFSDAVIEQSPFYNRFGIQIGAVDLMRVTRRAKLAFISSLNAKIMELPIGFNDRYRMLFALILDDKSYETLGRVIKSTLVFEFLSKARDSYGPVEIAIPQFTMTSEIDMKKILGDLGVNSLWTDPEVTRSISSPTALPSGFVQRSTITLNKRGVSPSPFVWKTTYNATAGDPNLRDFVANRPFLFGLFDSETYTCLMASIYTQPTYTY